MTEMYYKYKKSVVDKTSLHQKIIQEKEMLLDQIEKQRIEGIRLTEKIDTWLEIEQRRGELKAQEEIASQENLRKYMIEQSRCLAVATARKELMPEIVAQVVYEIETMYESEEAQKKYTTTIVNALERSHDE